MLFELFFGCLICIVLVFLFGLVRGWSTTKDYNDGFQVTEKTVWTFTWFDIIGVLVIMIITLSLPSVGCYIDTKVDAEKLKVQYKCNLNNTLTLAQNMNEKVVVRNEMDKVIVDVANLSQSSIINWRRELPALAGRGMRLPPLSD